MVVPERYKSHVTFRTGRGGYLAYSPEEVHTPSGAPHLWDRYLRAISKVSDSDKGSAERPPSLPFSPFAYTGCTPYDLPLQALCAGRLFG